MQQSNIGNKNDQVTRGHNIVEDGWAGAYNPPPHPLPYRHIHQHMKLNELSARFYTFLPGNCRLKDGPTDGQI